MIEEVKQCISFALMLYESNCYDERRDNCRLTPGCFDAIADFTAKKPPRPPSLLEMELDRFPALNLTESFELADIFLEVAMEPSMYIYIILLLFHVNTHNFYNFKSIWHIYTVYIYCIYIYIYIF